MMVSTALARMLLIDRSSHLSLKGHAMMRVFTHFVSSRVAILAGVELLTLMLAAYIGIAFQSSFVHGQESVLPSLVAIEVGGFAFVALFIMSMVGVYQLDIWGDSKPLLVRMAMAMLLIFGAAAFAQSYFVQLPALEHHSLGVTMLIAAIGTGLVRFGFYRIGKLNNFKRRILVLGAGSRVANFAKASLRNNMHLVVGYIAPQTSDNYVPFLRLLPMAPDQSLRSVVQKHQIDEIVVAVRDRRNGGLAIEQLLECKLDGITITELPTFFEREYRQVMLDAINSSWMVFGEGFSHGCCRAVVKRAFDLIASLILLVLTLPVMLITAICIILEDGLPVLYRQERVGQHGRVFNIYKFRSMRKDAERDGTPRWAGANDDRVTRVGRIIRKLRIDELPQIINVLKGEMSFVGPRPERPFFVDQLKQQIPYYSSRHSVKPGITGWAQVRHAYGASVEDTVEKLQYDLYYVKNHGLFLDLMTMIATVEVVLWGRGAR